MFGAKLVNPAQIYDELSCEQVKFTDVQTDRRTDAENDNTPSVLKAKRLNSEKRKDWYSTSPKLIKSKL